MKAYKWNYQKKDYDEVEIPDRSSVYCQGLYEVVQCASCGKVTSFSNGYTSRKIHTKGGLGYTVCATCHKKECQEEVDNG